jgi:proline iminopeptidase
MGGVRLLPVVDGRHKVWTKRVGKGDVKVLVLHGGPGGNHVMLEALEYFLPEAGIELYFYDQLGCGYSDRPEDTSLWTLKRYVQEVEEVRRGLGLDNFVLYGHSWGGVLAIEYALSYQQHLRAMVISNMTAGMTSLLKHLSQLKVQMLSPDKLVHLNAMEEKQAYDSPEYELIMMEDLYPQMGCRLKPWPEQVVRSLAATNQTIYNLMQGKSEFQMTGTLKDWERWDRLHELRTRVLAIGSRYDEMDPADMKKLSEMVEHGTYAYCPNGSHTPMWDDQKVYFQQLLAFLLVV